MPYPVKDETKEEYIARFMKSEEAQKDYPEQKQRLAVAYSLWEKRNITNTVTGKLKDPPTKDEIIKKFGITEDFFKQQLEKGIEIEKEHTTEHKTAEIIALHHLLETPNYYVELRNEKHSWPKNFHANHIVPGLVHYQDLGDIDPVTQRPKGMTFLVNKSAIDAMRKSFIGKPVYAFEHRPADPNDFKSGKADGIVTDAYFNAEDGWDYVKFIIWDDVAKEICEKGYSVSCAYMPLNVNYEKGTYNNIPYDGEIIDGEYTHLAIVSNPRYERAKIFANSKTGEKNMIKLLFEKLGIKNSVEVDKTIEFDMDGKKVKLEELVNAFKTEEARKEAETAKIEMENAIKEIKDDTKMELDGKSITFKDLKNAFMTMCERKNEEEKKKDEDKKKEEAEKMNSEEEKKKKDEEEKKAAEEKRNAEEAAKKEEAEKKEEEKRNSDGKKDLEEVKNSIASSRVEKASAYTPISEREKLGMERYGSAKTN